MPKAPQESPREDPRQKTVSAAQSVENLEGLLIAKTDRLQDLQNLVQGTDKAKVAVASVTESDLLKLVQQINQPEQLERRAA